MSHITIRPADGIWTVRSGGAVLAESGSALELTEGSYPPVIYFPRDDIAMAVLDRSDTSSHCPHKGDASYFSIVGKSGTLKDAAWSYETPREAVAQIRNHLAFYASDAVTIENI